MRTSGKGKGAEEESARDLSFTHFPIKQILHTYYASGPVLGVGDMEEDKKDCCQDRGRKMLSRETSGDYDWKLW